jgi:chromate transporter
LPAIRKFKAFVQGVTAAAVGAIAGAVVILGRRALIDWLTVLIACAVLFALLKVKKVPEPCLIWGAAVIGLLHHSVS